MDIHELCTKIVKQIHDERTEGDPYYTGSFDELLSIVKAEVETPLMGAVDQLVNGD